MQCGGQCAHFILKRLARVVYTGTQMQNRYVRVNGTLSKESVVKVGAHQGSVLSPLLFIMILEAWPCEPRSECPHKLLYANDFV